VRKSQNTQKGKGSPIADFYLRKIVKRGGLLGKEKAWKKA